MSNGKAVQLNFTDPNEVKTTGKVFFARKNLLTMDDPVKSFDSGKLIDKTPDIEVASYEIYLPKDDEILFTNTLGTLMVVPGKSPSQTTVRNFIGLYMMMRDVEETVLIQVPFETYLDEVPDWVEQYNKTFNNIAKLIQMEAPFVEGAGAEENEDGESSEK